MCPASNLLVEQSSHGDVPFSPLVVTHLKVSAASKGPGQQFQLFHAVESKMAYPLTHMTIGHQVPGIIDMHEAIGIGLAHALRLSTVLCMPCVITKAHSGSLDDRPSQSVQHLRLG